MATVRIVIALAASENWPLFQMDVYNSFLQGDLLEDVFMEIPKGLKVRGRNIWFLSLLSLCMDSSKHLDNETSNSQKHW